MIILVVLYVRVCLIMFVCSVYGLFFFSGHFLRAREKERRAALKPESRFVHVALNTSLHVMLDLFVLL